MVSRAARLDVGDDLCVRACVRACAFVCSCARVCLYLFVDVFPTGFLRHFEGKLEHGRDEAHQVMQGHAWRRLGIVVLQALQESIDL